LANLRRRIQRLWGPAAFSWQQIHVAEAGDVEGKRMLALAPLLSMLSGPPSIPCTVRQLQQPGGAGKGGGHRRRVRVTMVGDPWQALSPRKSAAGEGGDFGVDVVEAGGDP